MNSNEHHTTTEHGGHSASVVETNTQLLFTSIIKQAWTLFKEKGLRVYALMIVPIIFVLATAIISVTTIYIAAKCSGVDNLFEAFISVYRYARGYLIALEAVIALIVIIGGLYFALKSSVAAIKLLDSTERVTARHSWNSVSNKQVFSLLWVLLILVGVLAGGYILLFIPFLFLITFYFNVIFVNVLEGKKGADAFVISREYVRGYAPIVFVNLLFIVLGSMVLSKVISLLVGLLLYVVGHTPVTSLVTFILTTLATIVLILISFLVQVLIQSFSTIFNYTMFKKLKSLKAHVSTEIKKGRKTVWAWFITGIVLSVIVCVGVVIFQILMASKINLRDNQQDLQMMRVNSGYDNSDDMPSFDNLPDGPNGQY
ncbi:MAG: hypothetical protein WCG97_02995 [bacterium]